MCRRAASSVAWSALAVVFIAGAVWSTFLALRDAPVAPPGHGAQLQAFLPIVHGKPVLYAGQDRYAAYDLLGADTHVPLVEFPDEKVSPNAEKPFDTGDAYSPIDFDSFNRGTLNRFPYVVTSRGAWNSQAPPNFKRIAKTADFVLWERTGPTPRHRHVLLEGTEAGALAHCSAPEVRILLRTGGKASVFGETTIGTKPEWSDGSILGSGETTSQTLELPKGTWDLSLQYFSPFALSITAPGFKEELIAALDGQRPTRSASTTTASSGLPANSRAPAARSNSPSTPPPPTGSRASPAGTPRPTSVRSSRPRPNPTRRSP